MKKITLIWIGIVTAIVLLLYALKPMLLPFVLGLGLAYLLDPLADRLESKGLSRNSATAVVLGSFFAVFGVLGTLLVPTIYDQALGLINSLPDVWHKMEAMLTSGVNDVMARLSPEEAMQISKAVGGQGSAIAGFATDMLQSMWRSGMALVNILSLLFIMPLVAFYCLRDWDRMVAKIHKLLPRRHADTIKTLLRDMDKALSGFLHGQFMVCVMLATYYSIALNIAGLRYGLLMGLLSGFLVFVPYIGTFAATVAALCLAYVQFGNFSDVGIIWAIYLVAQFVEGNFITPRVVGERVGLHPAWIIFGMLAGGTLLGLVGVLIAVPMTAITGVLVRFGVARYLESELYLGTNKKNKKKKKLKEAQ